MIVVNPKTRTTLLCDRNHQAFRFISARAAIRHLMSGRAKGIDANGNVASWTGTDLNLSEASSLRWYNNEVSLYDDQPCLRSAPDPKTGEDRQWAIPTTMVCSYHFGYRNKSGTTTSLRQLFKVYKGICQYCYEKITFDQATKDHVIPQSAGGSNDDFNLVLACWECNNKKDSIHPYYDKFGKEVKPLNANKRQSFIPDDLIIRDEWKPYLFMA